MPGGLAASVRAKFPGIYDDLSDEQLEAKVLQKYPGYADLLTSKAPTQTAERKDANILGVNHNWIADKASKLPESLRYPAAFMGSLAGSVAESLSAPESVATMGAGKLPARVPGAPMSAEFAGAKAAAQKVAEDIPLVRKVRPALQAYQEASTAAQKAPGPTPVLRKAADAPTLSDSLLGALEEARGGNTAKGTTPPAPTATSAGKPSVTAARADEIAAAPKPAPAPPKPPVATGKSAKLADTAGGSDSLDVLQQAMSGNEDVPTVGNGTGGQLTPDEVMRLRRTYGAGRLGKIVAPTAPEVGVGQVLKDAPGPSRMPDIAKQALVRDIEAGKHVDWRYIKQLMDDAKRAGQPKRVDEVINDLVAKYGTKSGG